MASVSCLSSEGCLGTTYNFFSKSKVGVTVSIVVEIAALVFGILGITQVLPMGILASAITVSLAGGFFILTLVLVCSQFVAKQTPKAPIEDGNRDLIDVHGNAVVEPQPTIRSHKPISPSSKSVSTKSGMPLLPTALYTCSSEGVSSLQYWSQCSPLAISDEPCDKKHAFPVAASPTHGSQGFALGGHTHQYIIFDDGTATTYMDFQFPLGAKFMKPNMDTMLICYGMQRLFQEGLTFTHAIDVGAGSGFIAKYIATHQPKANVTAIDIDPKAGTYMQSNEAGIPQNVTIEVGNALTRLSKDGHLYDLVVSNPPYVPTLSETQSTAKVAVNDPNFWAGTTLICHMLEDTLPKMLQSAHLVMVIPSTALKAKRLFNLLHQQNTHFKARVVHQQEVAYKAWFAGSNKVTHLLANGNEKTKPTHFKGTNLDLFVGITKPGRPRDCKVEDGRRQYDTYYWQMVYIIDFERI